jgi:hypothetical protein
MSIFTCKRCSYETTIKRSIINHVERINKCKDMNNVGVVEEISKRYDTIKNEKRKRNCIESKHCRLCNHEFYDSSTRKRHEQICKFNKLLQPSAIQNSNNSNSNSNNNNNNEINNEINNINNNTQNVHIHINSYKDPLVEEYLEDKIRKYLISLKHASVDNFIKRCFPGVFNMIYFNENIPENHSISMIDKNLLVYDGKQLKVSDFDKINPSLESVLGYN